MLLNQVISLLALRKKLPEKFKDHSLTGDWARYKEYHITPNWLLVYRIDSDVIEERGC
ncbi:MAG: type II toxin-antitoxin system YafQ family toxin [Clostridia bacterium]|nr:type II toxin-antitoxin system YafQ family toxin [Clostridia bacterium]MDD4048748.1 type II toxin-antitoxin system YafQ family toxin [Clostridia bacterium]